MPAADSNARGENDRSGDIRLAGKPGYEPADFRLSADSPARGGGSTEFDVTNDFFGATRPGARTTGVDMGAIEFDSTASPVPIR